MILDNKRIVITGASDGIGREIALKLAEYTVTLLLIARDNARLEEVAQLCKKAGAQAEVFSCDITDVQQRTTALESVTSSGPIDILINNAGVWHASTPLEQLDPALIEATIQTNLTAQLLLTAQLIGDMKNRETAIINIVSSAGMQGRSGRTAYAASKYGMRGFTEALRDETRDLPIRIGAIFQSGTNTQMFAKADEQMPIDTYTQPEDLAEVIVFMLSRPPKIWLNEVHISY